MPATAVAPPTLPYASGHIQITREGDALVIDFPPPESAVAFWSRACVIIGVSLFRLVETFMPGGDVRIGSMTHSHPGGVVPRLISFALAAFLAFVFWSSFRTRRSHSVVTVRGSRLTFTRPGAWQQVSSEYDLSDYDDAGIESDEDGTYLALRRRHGERSAALAGGPSSRAGRVDLERAAIALRQAAWPDLAARSPRSEFTWANGDTLESDRGFAVRLPRQGVVEYVEPPRTMTLAVERACSADHAVCFVIPPGALRRWDGADGAPLPPAKQQEVHYNLAEALGHVGVRFMLHRTCPEAEAPVPPAARSPVLSPAPTQRSSPRSPS